MQATIDHVDVSYALELITGFGGNKMSAPQRSLDACHYGRESERKSSGRMIADDFVYEHDYVRQLFHII